MAGDGHRDPTRLIEGTRCLRSLRDESTVTCVVYERGAVVVRNTGAGIARRDGRAFVRIVQTP